MSILKRVGALAVGLLILGAGPVRAGAPALYAEFSESPDRFGLPGTFAEGPRLQPESTAGATGTGGSGPSPALAGVLSAVVPGAGQLLQGQRRGWVYLGVEVVAWFSFAALREVGNRSEDDFEEFADLHWDFDRYETETECGEGLGPRDFEEERDQLLELRETAKDDYYEDIGRQDVYACGWDDQGNRGDYLELRDQANRLFRASRWMTSAVLLNHVVSAVDAAKSAASRRKAEALHSWRWQVAPTPRGDVAVQLELNRSF